MANPHGPLRVGVGGPVGSGKTALMDALCKRLRDRYEIAAITNDIYTKWDAEYLVRSGALAPERIAGVETGGCPHTAIREDASINLAAVADMQKKFPELDLVLAHARQPSAWHRRARAARSRYVGVASRPVATRVYRQRYGPTLAPVALPAAPEARARMGGMAQRKWRVPARIETERLTEEVGTAPPLVNLGGGFGIHYRKQEGLPASAFASVILPAIAETRSASSWDRGVEGAQMAMRGICAL